MADLSGEFAFDRFVVRPDTRQLLVDGEPAKLGARAFDLLAALIERRERVVSKDELLELVWSRVVVEENTLQVHISALRKLLGLRAIATVPGRGYRFTADIGRKTRLPDPGGGAADRRPPGNLPEVLPALYGRERDLKVLLTLLQTHRLVTLIGAGGIGKTRLAQAAAHSVRDRWSDGAWMVELAPVVDPELLPATAARALGARLSGQQDGSAELAQLLRGKVLLLVLDNCEHLLQAAAALASALLAQAPGVKVLATSQAPLSGADEQRFRVQPLTVPSAAQATNAQNFGALALFDARARAVDPRFELDEHNITPVIEICRRLDGLPLAIELAAARVPLLGVEGVRNRLHDRFRLLAAAARTSLPRHQTLRATIEWSYSLLGAHEQAVLRRLGVFAGGFRLDSAQRVAADEHIDEWAVLDHLGALVDKSLVVAEPGAEPRYRLLETGRAFAIEKLGEAAEMDQTQRRHAQAFLALFEDSFESHWTLATQAFLQQYLPDLENLRAALDWAAKSDGETELQVTLAGATARLWHAAGLRAEGLRRCAQARERISAATAPELEARLQLAYSELAFPSSTSPQITACERAIDLYRQVGDRRGLFLALTLQGRRLSKLRKPEQAVSPLGEAERLMEDSWPLSFRRRLLHVQAFTCSASGRWDKAREMWEVLLKLDRASGNLVMVVNSLANLVDSALALDDAGAAVLRGRELLATLPSDRSSFGYERGFGLGMLGVALTRRGEFDEALQTAREASSLLRLSGLQGMFLDHFSLLAFKLGRPVDAARSLGRAEANSVARSEPRELNEQLSRDEVLKLLQQTLSAAELDLLLKEGAALSDDEAARTALGE